MTIFSNKKQNKEEKKVSAATVSTDGAIRADYMHILYNPRITEKATASALSGIYLFDVAPSATKRDIMLAVKAVYKVIPRKVTVAAVPSKNVRNARTGKRGVKSGGKKAYVYLKKGETLTIA